MCHIFFRNPLATPVMCLITTATQVGDFFFISMKLLAKPVTHLLSFAWGYKLFPSGETLTRGFLRSFAITIVVIMSNTTTPTLIPAIINGLSIQLSCFVFSTADWVVLSWVLIVVYREEDAVMRSGKIDSSVNFLCAYDGTEDRI